MDLKKLNLDNICDGAAKEIFEREVEAMLKNISDPNTATADTRKITLEFSFKPSPGMEFMHVEIQSKSKLAHIAGVQGGAHLQRKGVNLEAFAQPSQQRSLFDDDNVKSIEEGRS